MIVCRTVAEIAEAVEVIIEREKNSRTDDNPSFFFRGEGRNYAAPRSRALGTSFLCCLDRKRSWIDNERQLYEDALRYNVASFHEDRTMVERLARMQHYQLPTRFADISENALLAAHFAVEESRGLGDEEDGFIRVMRVAGDRLKSFTSDVIVAIAHLPLADAKHVDLKEEENGLAYLTYEIKNERIGFNDFCANRELYRELCRELQHVWAFRPILNNMRIRNQGGAFLAFGCRTNKESLNPTFSSADYDREEAPSCGIMQADYICIPAGAKKTIREQLVHFGVTPECVYPELSNVCESLKERYGETIRN